MHTIHDVRGHLRQLERKIIFKLLDRAQYAHNSFVYSPESGVSYFPGLSLFELRLSRIETVDALFGRYTVPEERPFTTRTEQPLRVCKRADGIKIKDYNLINLTADIKAAYLALLPKICKPGDDGEYGSTVEHDVAALQAISERIHWGAFYAAETKYSELPEEYGRLIAAKDRDGLMKAITDAAVEQRILERVLNKVMSCQSCDDSQLIHIVPPDVIVDFFRNTIIPLTKKGQVEYLIRRGK